MRHSKSVLGSRYLPLLIVLGAPWVGHAAPLPAPDHTLQSDHAFLDFSVARAAGDVNGDGYDDITLRAEHIYVYLGSASGVVGSLPADADTTIVASSGLPIGAGDVNADGYDDLVIGDWTHDPGGGAVGAAYLFLGGVAGITATALGDADQVLLGDQVGSLFGLHVEPAGDVNADGYDDLLVGANAYATGGGEQGAVFVFLGNASGFSGTGAATAHRQIDLEPGTHPSSWPEMSIDSAGDVNADGYDDILVGSPFTGNLFTGQAPGIAFLFHGSAAGITGSDPSSADQTLVPDDIPNLGGGANFGYVAGAGDVDGDGFDDVVVGAPNWENGGTGGAFVFRGGPTGLATTTTSLAHARFEETEMGFATQWSLGQRVDGVGDFNADGYDDIVLSAPRFIFNGVGVEGIALVYPGSATGIADTSFTGTIVRVQGNTQFGFAQGSGVGDVNGDGGGDFAVTNFTWEEFDGGAYLYHGAAVSVPALGAAGRALAVLLLAAAGASCLTARRHRYRA